MPFLHSLSRHFSKSKARTISTRASYRPLLENLETRWVPNVDFPGLLFQQASLLGPVANTQTKVSSSNQFNPSLVRIATTKSASAQSLLHITGKGHLAESSDGTATLHFKGRLAKVGDVRGYAELTFDPNFTTGTGAVVLEHDHSLLVGKVNYSVDAQGKGRISFTWQDSVHLRDGRTVANTRNFAKSRPAGAEGGIKTVSKATVNQPQDGHVVIAIIAILIGF